MPDFIFNTAITGSYDIRLPQWGRAFWQDSNDGEMFLAFASGRFALAYTRSADSGVSWSPPVSGAPLDDFAVHNNFDTFMDPRGHVHCAYRFQGSGCYKLLGKVSGGNWTVASGDTLPKGFVDAADSGNVKGFNGSIHVMEAPGGVAGEVSAKFPLVRIAAKGVFSSGDFVKSYYLGDPFRGNFTVEEIGAITCGSGGGFPMGYSESANAGYGVVFYSEPSGMIVSREKGLFGPWQAGSTFGSGPDAGRLILQSGDIPFGPNMGIGSGACRKFNALAFTSNASGNGFWGIRELSGTSVYSKLDSQIVGAGVDEGVLPWQEYIPTSGIYGVGHNYPGSGTNCDLSFTNSGDTVLYFQNLDFMGRQVITRMLTKASRNSVISTQLIASNFFARPSGGINVAQASHTTTGGFANRVFYDKFKALRHSRNHAIPNTAKRAEYLVTGGHVSAYPSGGQLTVWNVENSPEIIDSFTIPYYQMDYTATSGTSNIFQGVSNQTNFTASTIASAFDGNSPLTFAQCTNGASITLRLDKPRVIDRIEVVGNSTSSSLTVGNVNQRDIGRIDVYASFDNTNFSHVGTIPSGNANGNSRLRSLTTNRQYIDAQSLSTDGVEFIQFFNACSARYIRFNFTTQYATTARRISEFRLFGPAYSAREITTFDHIYTLQPPVQLPYMEKFRTQHGSLPAGWNSYGDFSWYVVASGDATRNNTQSLPAYSDGMVPSGIFKFVAGSNGNGDGFSLISEPSTDSSGLVSHIGRIPSGGIGPGHSGVVETIVQVASNESYAEGSSGRRISFDIRVDPHSQDEVEFYTVDNPVFAPTGVLRYYNQGVLTDWTNYTFYLQAGTDTTLRWVYKRNGPPSTYGYGAAWIDNMEGLTGPPRVTIGSFMVGLANYVESGIHGYMRGNSFESINAYMSGYPTYSSINAYLISDIHADTVGSINSFVYGYPDGYINAYMLAGSGLTTFPTGGINGFLLAPISGSGPSHIDGYLEGDWGQSIHGYLSAYQQAGISGAEINAYLKTFDGGGSIHGVIGSPSTTVGSPIYGYLDSRFGDGDQVINAYLMAPDGGFGNVNAYTPGWNEGPGFFLAPQSMILGYINGWSSLTGAVNAYMAANYPFTSIYAYMGSEALVASGGGSIGGGPGDGSPSTSNVIPGTNWIQAYLKGYSGDQSINAYLMAPPGGYNDINAYMFSGASDDQIWGNLTGYDSAATGIHGYASGIGFVQMAVNAFMEGVSGIPSSTIFGVLTGMQPVSDSIIATMIGSTTGVSSAACFSHGFPLQAVPTVSIPTNFFNP